MQLDPTKYLGIPEDFPVEPQPFALAGAQPKAAMVEEKGIYYAEGTRKRTWLDPYMKHVATDCV